MNVGPGPRNRGLDRVPGVVGSEVFRKGSFRIPSSAETLANARLIAAAPDLLAALRELVTLWDSPEPFTGADALQAIGEATERARAAIAKAREGATD